jgi:hypothetical protein
VVRDGDVVLTRSQAGRPDMAAGLAGWHLPKARK